MWRKGKETWWRQTEKSGTKCGSRGKREAKCDGERGEKERENLMEAEGKEMQKVVEAGRKEAKGGGG